MALFDSLLLNVALYEINAQPTVFKKSFFKLWNNPPNDFSLDLYAYFLAKKKKLKINRIKVFFGPRYSGVSKWNTGLKEGLNLLKELLILVMN